MKAMILAAGLGTRLRPLTDSRPKALVELNGVPLLEIVLERLMTAGVREVIVNTFHLGDQIDRFLKARDDFGIRIETSPEESLLDTGGGLQQASWFFDDGNPFIMHNVDVISDIDLVKMYRHHCEQQALATLAVKKRKTKRYLLFDERSLLCGHLSHLDDQKLITRKPQGKLSELAFGGIHVISPAIFDLMTERGKFSIIRAYLRLAGLGEKIIAFATDEYQWSDVGKPEQLRRLEHQLASESI